MSMDEPRPSRRAAGHPRLLPARLETIVSVTPRAPVPTVNHVASGPGVELTNCLVNVLASTRRARGLSLQEVAERARLHRTSLGLIERHERGVTVDVALRIAWSLGLSLGDLVTECEQTLSRASTLDSSATQ